MRGALAIAAAELRAHRLALWAGLALGLLVAVLVALTDLPLALGALGAAMSIAIALGAGAVSRDLAERRLGFYLARPLSPLAYWAGKMSAALLLAIAAGLLALLPGLLFGALSWVDTRGMTWSTTAAALARNWRPLLVMLAFLVAAAGAAGGAIRARSGLLILDIVMVPLTWAALFVAFGNTWDVGTDLLVVRFAFPWLWPLATLALLAAGAAQVCIGRLDVKRGHALLSAIAWGGLLVCVGGILLFSRYVAGVAPADLRMPYGMSVHAPRAGHHVMLEGISRRWSHEYHPGFLLDAQGQFVRMGGLESFKGLTGFAWSDDGRRFAWSMGRRIGPPQPLRSIPGFQPSIWIMGFDEAGASPRRLARKSDDPQAVRALSPSGRRLLVTTETGKEIVDVESGRTIASIDESSSWASPTFLSETTVRALRTGPAQARIVEWDVASGAVTERGMIALQGGPRFASLVPTDDWQRVLRFDASGLFLHDLEGRVVATLVDRWPTQMNRTAGPLSGGRFGSVEEEPEGLRLRVFESEGRPLAEARFKGRFPLRVGGESAPGLLALGVAPFTEDAQRETLFVDLATGRVARRVPGLSPALRRWESGPPGDSQNPEPGSLATRLFMSDEGLVSLDPASGARTVLVRRRDRLED